MSKSEFIGLMAKLLGQQRDMVVESTGFKPSRGNTIEGGYGDFGITPTNPVPLTSVIANAAYMARLRTLDGRTVTHHRLGSVQSPNVKAPVDAYEVSQDGRVIATVYICSYNYADSQLPPVGFKLL